MRKRDALDRLEQDIADHIARETRDNIERGLSPEEAHRQALIAFGNVALVKEDTRAVWRARWVEPLLQDVRYALRASRRNPGFSAVVVLTLALGIGANTAIFSLVEAIMLRTLPLQAPQELQFIAHGSAGRATPGSNYPYVERMRSRTDVFASVTAYLRMTFRVATGDVVERTAGQFASGNYHAVLGVPVVLGRGFVADDDRNGAGALAVVISDGFWARRFGRAPDVIGRTLAINSRQFEIVGVTAPGFSGLDPGTSIDITVPMAVRTLDQPGFLTDHQAWFGDMPVVARLKRGVTSTQASAAADAVFQQYLSEPENEWLFGGPKRRVIRATLIDAAHGTAGLRTRYSRSILVLMAMVGVVLFIGCANVANLLLARGTARAKEVAVRMALGAGRPRLVRQFLTESMVLAVTGGALGFVLARVGVGVITALVGTGADPIWLDLQPNATVLMFTAVVSVLTGVLFGLAPAVGTTRVALTPAMSSGGSTTARPGRRWSTSQLLVTAQIALCVCLVSSAGLLARTLQNLETRAGGFDRSNVLLFSLSLRGASPRPGQLSAVCDDVIARLSQHRDILSASCSRNIPVNTRGNARPLDVPGAPPRPLDTRIVFTNMVTPAYFRALGIGVVAGRAFEARDTANSERVAIINRSAARFFFGGEDPIGRRVHYFKDDDHPRTIVGVVEDALQRSLREGAPMTVYTPLAQLDDPESMATVAVRTRRDPLMLAASVRDVSAVGADAIVDDVRTMDQQIGSTLVQERLLAWLSSAFGLLALALSCIGLYGVVSYDVMRRLRDVGIRIALGADRVDVLRHVVHGAMSVSAVGILLGLTGAFAATQLLTSLLFGVTPRDPVTLTTAAVLLVATTLIASLIPARRASRVNPVAVLRAE